MSGLTTVFLKEVRENIRDRRALFNSLLLGPLLFPLLFVGLMWFLESAERAGQDPRPERAFLLAEAGALAAAPFFHRRTRALLTRETAARMVRPSRDGPSACAVA